VYSMAWVGLLIESVLEDWEEPTYTSHHVSTDATNTVRPTTSSAKSDPKHNTNLKYTVIDIR